MKAIHSHYSGEIFNVAVPLLALSLSKIPFHLGSDDIYVHISRQQLAFLDNYRGTFRWHICFNFGTISMSCLLLGLTLIEKMLTNFAVDAYCMEM